ncbi:hypothetical protein ACM42_05080 [Bradyrhizobium sp. CCBAU 25338]|nr:hypothetical protein [Bradyrhizobium sp. CCBAU 25338]
MRLVRAIVGLALLAVGLYVIIGEHHAGTSADATLNARLYIVRAPIEGKVTLAVKSIGARISPGELIAEINDQRFDTARLLELDAIARTSRSRSTVSLASKRPCPHPGLASMFNQLITSAEGFGRLRLELPKRKQLRTLRPHAFVKRTQNSSEQTN